MATHNPITEVETTSEIELNEPKRYGVLLHNDNVTTFDCVIRVLQLIFYKSFEEAFDITNTIHHNGKGVAGIYNLEVAREKTEEASKLANSLGYPLKVTYEEV